MVDIKHWIDGLLTAPSLPVSLKTAWITFMLQVPFVPLLLTGPHGNPIGFLFFSPASNLMRLLLTALQHPTSYIVAFASIFVLQSLFVAPLVFWIVTRQR